MEKRATERRTVLVVDDDPNILEVLEARLSLSDFDVVTAGGAEEALVKMNASKVDLVITDVRMPGMGGDELFRRARSLQPHLPVILLTAFGTIPDAVRAIKEGVVDYLTKPFDGQDLVRKVREILGDPSFVPPDGATSDLSEALWGGRSPSMKELYDMMKRIIPSHVNILILGESGVGKELVARLIHERGPRRAHPFVVVDCGSTPATLLESELFGHVKGSFTHAIRDKKGLIEAADRGTLFLDEIGNISPEMQIRLLRFLEDRKIRRIGDLRETPVDCRVIAATHVNLPKEVEEGNFREDLYYRLRVVTIRIPPLRERSEDIPILSRRFMEAFCKAHKLPMKELPPETMRWLSEYPWPGNVRELKNAMEAGIVMSGDGLLEPRHFHLTGLPEKPQVTSPGSSSLSLEQSERNLIIRALEKTKWVQKDAAKLLGVSRRVLHYKIRKFGIELPGKRSSEADASQEVDDA